MHVIATAGHVDHGKSTLVRALTGMEPDRWAEERRRGMTIDLGFAWTRLPDGATVAFVDVPGHERFVGTMLAGVGPVPVVMFVVAADEGWMPQSREHLDALAALGVTDGVLVITRSDLMDPELALEEALEQLAASPLGRLPSVCVSGRTGAGLDALRAELTALTERLPAPDPSADVRLWVDRAFTIRGAGTVVTGTLPSGRIRAGDELMLEPGGRRVAVRGVQSLGRAVDSATGVARVAVNLRGIAHEAVRRGDALVTPGRWLAATVVDVRLRTTGPEPPDGPARAEMPDGELTLHIGASAQPVRVRPLGVDTARLTLRTALPLRIGDRGVLRDPGGHRVVSGVTALDVCPPPLRRRGAAARRARELTAFTGTSEPAAEVARRGLVRRGDLVAMGADPSALTSSTTSDGPTGPSRPGDAVLEVDGWLISPDALAALAERLVEEVIAHRRAHPLEPGVPVAAATQRLELPEPRLLRAVLSSPPASARLVSKDGRIQLTDIDDGLPTVLRSAIEAVREDLERSPFSAPETARLAELGLGPPELAALVRAGELDRIAPGIYLLPGAELAAVEALADLGEAEFTLSTARQRLATTRRVAVPLLELLARHGHTTRDRAGRHRLTRRR